MSSLYDELLQYGLRRHDFSLGMANHYHPLSITEDEFHFIQGYVAARGYQSGYEVATAFGVGACAVDPAHYSSLLQYRILRA